MSVFSNVIKPQGLEPLQFPTKFRSHSWILHYLITNESKYELRSFLSLGWLALLRGGYALSAIVVTYSTLGFLAATVRDVWIDQHIVVVGWNRRARHLVEELKRLKHEFVVVLPAADTQVDVELSKDLVIRRDDLRSGLAASQAAYARAIIVLANEAPEGDSADHADLWVARTTIEIKRFLSKAVKTDQETARVGDGQRDQDDNDAPRILVEINDHRHKEMLESLKVNRVVCVSDFGIELLAQAAAKDSVLVDVHSELLNTTHTTHEFYFVKISAEEAAAAQRRYDGLARLAIESSDVLVVGLVQATSSGQRVARIAPFGASLRAGDQAILLAKEQPTRILRIRDAEQ